MRTIKLLLALLSLSLFSCGPFEEVNMGYPESVTFSKEGGVETISEDDAKAFRHITIIDYKTAGEGMFISNEGEGGATASMSGYARSRIVVKSCGLSPSPILLANLVRYG